MNSPCNWVLGREDQRDLLSYCLEQNILLIADEVYHRHYFSGQAAPLCMEIVDEGDPVVIINDLSKA